MLINLQANCTRIKMSIAFISNYMANDDTVFQYIKSVQVYNYYFLQLTKPRSACDK